MQIKLSENFTLEEMVRSMTAEKFKIPNIPDANQVAGLRNLCVNILQPIRDKWGKPIRISSGFRSYALNKKVGGVATSQHLKGEAADIVCDDNNVLWKIIREMIYNGEIVVGQLIDEKNLMWIHISLPMGKNVNQILKL